MRRSRRHDVVMREGFEWGALVWHEATRSGHETCSYCHTELLFCEAPLVIWRGDGACAELCESCRDEWLSE